MSPKLSPRAGFLVVLLCTLLSAISIPIYHVIFHLPFRDGAFAYLAACPLLLIAGLGGFRMATTRTMKRSKSQKIVLFAAIPLLALVLWLGLITGHRLLGAVLWYVGNLIVAGYVFLGGSSGKAPHE
jgi:hypothetical protein